MLFSKTTHFLFFLLTFLVSCSDGNTTTEETDLCTKTCLEGYTLNSTSCECECTKTCLQGYAINSENCMCEPEPCTKTCDVGYTLNNTSCDCECTKTCDSGYTLNTSTCECVEDFVANIVVVEAETAILSGDWKKKTTISGYSADGYIVWEGADQFWKGADKIGNTGRLTYKVNIPRAGTYLVQWRSYIAKVDPSKPNSEHNDSWLRLPDADDFYGKKNNGSIVYPKGSGKTPNPAGENGNGFFKVYMNTSGAWTWASGTSDNNFHSIYARFDNVKEYTIEIAARSSYHAIDKIRMTEQKP